MRHWIFIHKQAQRLKQLKLAGHTLEISQRTRLALGCDSVPTIMLFLIHGFVCLCVSALLCRGPHCTWAPSSVRPCRTLTSIQFLQRMFPSFLTSLLLETKPNDAHSEAPRVRIHCAFWSHCLCFPCKVGLHFLTSLWSTQITLTFCHCIQQVVTCSP